MIEVIVKHKRQEADDIVSFELVRCDGDALPPFTAGAHIDVQVGEGLMRQYSLCSHPAQRESYLIGVLRDPASRGVSIALHDRVQQGDTLLIGEPRNLFRLQSEARRSLLMAGGIGITPMLCMAEQLWDSGADFELHYCARSKGRMAFYDRIRNAPFADRVFFHFDNGAAEQKLDSASLLAAEAAQAGSHLYVCGPTGFMNAILTAAAEAGWPAERLHREYFAAPEAGASSDNSAFEVKIASTGALFMVERDKKITEVLAEHGIVIPVGCNEGVCGTCLTRVLEGEPDHRDVCLSDAERAANDQFMPCCSRSKSKLLVLDI
ncbi:MAG TPA: PDR/VanB family oxidoreductase [Noviherbaspirillum sp.]|uniref:PDR/VanB family oxidoreductase n=1 Tax=Noviherbaspirillum sp. TaxID=1926288 RepID=UPI002B4730D0|nr:PDR/VanB family oxidoreductase [Noviherbaspirillum sp.]HJV86896.1 PDR/VanB family oxidoreductase [Noviherbaspirillum sp.]